MKGHYYYRVILASISLMPVILAFLIPGSQGRIHFHYLTVGYSGCQLNVTLIKQFKDVSKINQHIQYGRFQSVVSVAAKRWR